MKDRFYKYIIKTQYGYEIKKGNEKFGSYKKLTDALYERDRLIKANWNWDDALQLEETPNHYEKMELPRFIHEMSYIHKFALTYEVYLGKRLMGKFNTKRDAYAYANEIGGEVKYKNIKYRVQKSIDGKNRYFGQFKTLKEAQKRRNQLERNGWEYDKYVE